MGSLTSIVSRGGDILQNRKLTKSMLSRKLRHHNASIVFLPVLTVRKTMIKLLKFRRHVLQCFFPKQKSNPSRRSYPQDLPISVPPSIAQNMKNYTPLSYTKAHYKINIAFGIASVLKTLTSIRWFLLITLLYLSFGVLVLLFQQGISPFKETIIYSVIGFLTFFMGYFGWIVAQDIIKIINKKNIFS